jgi:hypothetical protein
MKKLKKKYAPTAFRLWKHDNKRGWYHYNQIFDCSDETTYDYMTACKMMCHGWEPYSMIMTPGEDEPLQLGIVDYEPLERMIEETDPIGVVTGKAIREFIQKTPVDGRKNPRSRLENKAKVIDRALAIAIESHKNGSYIPKHLLERVLDTISKGEQNV